MARVQSSISHMLQLIIVAVVVCVFVVDAWLLAQVGLNESYRVRHLSTHFSRVFLSITVESKTFPTLIEAQWPETFLPMRTAIYPHRSMHANGNHSDCTRIHQARWSQVDSLSRLWVMDIGWRDDSAECPPKLVAFDLIRHNAEILRIDCDQYLGSDDSKLITIKLGPKPASCHVEKFIYFVLANDSHILAYDILEQKWHRRQLISKKYSSVTETFPIQPIDLNFGRNAELLISDTDGSLYTSANGLLRNADNTVGKQDDKLEMKLLGSLLGPSRGMMIEHHTGALFYVVPKFGALVRCSEYKQNLTAESNEIIYMTSKNVQQIFFGSEGSVWLLTDRTLKPQDYCFAGV